MLLVKLLLLAPSVNGFVIDTASCNANAVAYLSDKLGCAFNMAQQATNQLQNPISLPVTTLMNSLFPITTTPTVITAQEAILCRFAGQCPVHSTPAEYFQYSISNGPRQWPNGILSMADQRFDVSVGGVTGTPADDVIFYCNTQRYKDIKDQSTGKSWIQDTSINEVIYEGDPDPRKWCFGALAFTWTSEDATKPSQITICPWFLAYTVGLRLPACTGWRQRLVGVLGKPIAKLSTKWPYTAIDLLSLFDKVMVHELTHTRHGGTTEDCLIDNTGSPGLLNTGYGWKNAKQLALRATEDTNYEKNQKSVANADSFGLFASGVRIIEAGGIINSDGSVSRYKPGSSSTTSSAMEDGVDLTAEDEEFMNKLAELFGEDTDGEGKTEPVDMRLWSESFNATMFPPTTNLTELQKNSVVAALMGNMHVGHRH